MNIRTFITEVYRGKTIGRIFFNQQIIKHANLISGTVIDLAGGGEASYYRYLPKNLSIIRTNYIAGENIDKVVDLSKSLPFDNETFDTVLLFNALYIIKDQETLLAEVKRIMKSKGTLLLSSPFISAEMPEPNDYRRLTQQGLEVLFSEVGFSSVKIFRVGERATAAAYLLSPIAKFNTIRLIMYAIAMGIDRIIPRRLKEKHPVPIGYFCILTK